MRHARSTILHVPAAALVSAPASPSREGSGREEPPPRESTEQMKMFEVLEVLEEWSGDGHSRVGWLASSTLSARFHVSPLECHSTHIASQGSAGR